MISSIAANDGSLWTQIDCSGWLDSKPAGSVLYVSFGSLVETNEHVICEVAHGLLLSGVNFIWVLREGIIGSGDVTNVLPVGFADEIKDKALVVPWCDQIRVLSSPAVGGFLTHCGWNSTLESMWCGVPMICYPLTYDQPTNAKIVVDDLGIGIRLCERGGTVDRVEVGERIKDFVSVPVGERLREEARKVKEKFRSAVEVGGSSERNFDRFIVDLKEKIALGGK
ncbi:UDP-glycosyltransferase 86A1 [Striga hermonthica]|uniref:UDP-glycosyltransferase 86A1 n=1 Tax=Striga hermonthica TaxID=68872 RepID=A0A9N7RJE8_STRHE|nr:UDP-glycosyltransferase 86A1 [Striga hermonthica]